MARTYHSPKNNGHNGNYQNNIHSEPPRNPNNHQQSHRRNGPYLPKRNHHGGDHRYKPNNHNSQNHRHQYGRFHQRQNTPHNFSNHPQHDYIRDRALVTQEPAFSRHSTAYGNNTLSTALSRYHGLSRNRWIDISQPMHENGLVAFDGTQRDTDGDLIMDEAPELRTFSFHEHADMLLRGAQNMANCAADLQSLSAYINTVEQCFFPSFDQRSSVYYYG